MKNSYFIYKKSVKNIPRREINLSKSSEIEKYTKSRLRVKVSKDDAHNLLENIGRVRDYWLILVKHINEKTS